VFYGVFEEASITRLKTSNKKTYVKVKVFCYKPGVAPGVPGG
jgi:hypothetical protein